DPKQIEAALNAGEEGKQYWTFTKDPSIQAFTDLMNRALDKPTEQIQHSAELNLHTEISAKLQAARHRGRQRLLEEAKLKESVVAELEVRVVEKSQLPQPPLTEAEDQRHRPEEPGPRLVRANGNAPEKDVQVRTFRSNPKPREWG